MLIKSICSLCVVGCVSLGAFSASANIQPDRWLKGSVEDGRDIWLTIQLIEEDPPNFDTTFTLTGNGDTIFQNKQFTREEADEVVGPGCIELNASYGEPDGGLPDCDSDGVGECEGICGTAYRYTFFDECVENDYWGYFLYDDANPGSEIGYAVAESPLPDDACLDDSSCSATPGIGRASEAGLAALMLLVGLGAVVAARRRRAR